MRHGAKIAQLELELRLRGAQQMPVGIAEPRFESVIALSGDHIPGLFTPLLASDRRARDRRSRGLREALAKDAIAAFMRVAAAQRRIGKASLDRSRIRLRARRWGRRARPDGEPKARGDEQGHRRKAHAFASMREEALGAHPLLFDWAS